MSFPYLCILKRNISLTVCPIVLSLPVMLHKIIFFWLIPSKRNLTQKDIIIYPPSPLTITGGAVLHFNYYFVIEWKIILHNKLPLSFPCKKVQAGIYIIQYNIWTYLTLLMIQSTMCFCSILLTTLDTSSW